MEEFKAKILIFTRCSCECAIVVEVVAHCTPRILHRVRNVDVEGSDDTTVICARAENYVILYPGRVNMLLGMHRCHVCLTSEWSECIGFLPLSAFRFQGWCSFTTSDTSGRLILWGELLFQLAKKFPPSVHQKTPCVIPPLFYTV